MEGTSRPDTWPERPWRNWDRPRLEEAYQRICERMREVELMYRLVYLLDDATKDAVRFLELSVPQTEERDRKLNILKWRLKDIEDGGNEVKYMKNQMILIFSYSLLNFLGDPLAWADAQAKVEFKRLLGFDFNDPQLRDYINPWTNSKYRVLNSARWSMRSYIESLQASHEICKVICMCHETLPSSRGDFVIETDSYGTPLWREG